MPRRLARPDSRVGMAGRLHMAPQPIRVLAVGPPTAQAPLARTAYRSTGQSLESLPLPARAPHRGRVFSNRRERLPSCRCRQIRICADPEAQATSGTVVSPEAERNEASLAVCSSAGTAKATKETEAIPPTTHPLPRSASRRDQLSTKHSRPSSKLAAMRSTRGACWLATPWRAEPRTDDPRRQIELPPWFSAVRVQVDLYLRVETETLTSIDGSMRTARRLKTRMRLQPLPPPLLN